jgi:hypothetical protein
MRMVVTILVEVKMKRVKMSSTQMFVFFVSDWY